MNIKNGFGDLFIDLQYKIFVSFTEQASTSSGKKKVYFLYIFGSLR